MPPRCLGGRTSRAATTAAGARLWRVSAVLFFLGCVGQRGNDVQAFAFAPPSSARQPPSASSCSTSHSATRGRNGGGPAAAAASSSSSRGVVRRQQQQQQGRRGCSYSVARTSPLAISSAVSPLRAGVEDDGYEGAGEDRAREEGETGSESRGGSGAAGEGAGEGGAMEPGLAMPDIVNPFKLAFEAGQNLRATLANTLEQITGTASPVSLTRVFC